LLWTSIRLSSYLFGGICLGGYSLVQANLTGLGYAFLWPNSPAWNQISLLVVAGVTLLALAKFTQRFLRLDEHSPRLSKWFSWSAVVCGISVGAAAVFPYQWMIMFVLALVA